jgi:hypothetical protein
VRYLLGRSCGAGTSSAVGFDIISKGISSVGTLKGGAAMGSEKLNLAGCCESTALECVLWFTAAASNISHFAGGPPVMPMLDCNGNCYTYVGCIAHLLKFVAHLIKLTTQQQNLQGQGLED